MFGRSIYCMSVISLSSLCCIAQVTSPTLQESLSATATPELTSVQAGEAVPIRVTLGAPAPRDLSFHSQIFCGGVLMVYGQLKKGETETVVQVQTSPDGGTGECRFESLDIPPVGPSAGKIIDVTTIKLKVPVVFKVVGLPHVKETLPTTASATVEPTKRQFFRTRAVPLVELRGDLTAELEKNSADTDDLREKLIAVLSKADQQLQADQEKYSATYLTAGQHNLAFFSELHKRYGALIIDIRAAEKQVSRAELYGSPRLILAQELKSRPEPSLPQERYSQYSGTFSPDASAAMQLLEWHIAAYSRVADTGDASFSLSLASRPEGATVYGKMIGQNYTPLGKQTNVPDTKFDFATWTFKFVKTGCADLTRQYDPVNDTTLILEVELICK